VSTAVLASKLNHGDSAWLSSPTRLRAHLPPATVSKAPSPAPENLPSSSVLPRTSRPTTAKASTKSRRSRSHSGGELLAQRRKLLAHNEFKKQWASDLSVLQAKAQTMSALKENDGMVYLEGPNVYSCAHCRTHFTSHDEIISKSFHGRHGRAFLFESCVNVDIGEPENRTLITGLHSVCDINCSRCKQLVGWTYAKAYAASQKYKEGKFIIEKINLHVEGNRQYKVAAPAGAWSQVHWTQQQQRQRPQQQPFAGHSSGFRSSWLRDTEGF